MFTDLCTYPELDSTNSEAARLIRAGRITAPTILRADLQTQGRGSRGRNWQSGQGNLLATYIMPAGEDWPPLQLAVYPLALGLHDYLSGLLSAHKDLSLQLKWPNDLLVNTHKIGGALHEIEHYQGRQFLITGIGLNLQSHPESTDSLFPPAHLAQFATAFDLPALDDMARQLGAHLGEKLALWQKEGFSTIRAALLPLFYGYEREISLSLNRDRNTRISGRFEALQDDGALVLHTNEGVRAVYTADIFPTLPEG